LFNANTVDQVLDHLMTSGIKVQGGDKLGKTIIFAKNHEHAVFIEQRLNKNYPEYAGKFLHVIDNYETKAQSLLEMLVDKYEEHEPQIAVSVDMMDTGVDAPRVVNLGFFKQVKSSIKFWQMIGRGTRLCPDLFGPGLHKKEFAIFDYCQNFEFFGVNPNGIEGNLVKSLTQQVFEAKLELALLLREKADCTDEQCALAEVYITELHQLVAGLEINLFVIKANMRAVVEYSDKARWANLSKGDRLDVSTHLSMLILPNKNDVDELALLTGAYRTYSYINKISSTAKTLLKKQNIPAIAMQVSLLNELQTEPFWQAISINPLNKVCVALRDLIKYLDKDNQVNVFTTFEDDLDYEGIRDHDLLLGYGNLQSYKDRMESYIRDHKDHLVINKLKTNIPIT
jgi:type I restriction enzyme R subunit